MRKIMISMALAGSVIATATPAMAQFQFGDRYDQRRDQRYDNGYNESGRLRQIGQRIERGIQTGRLDQREAYALRREYANLVRLDQRSRYGRVSHRERAMLDQRVAYLAQRVRQAMQNGNAYGRPDFARNAPYGTRGYDTRYNDDRYNGDDRYSDGRRYDDPRNHERRSDHDND